MEPAPLPAPIASRGGIASAIATAQATATAMTITGADERRASSSRRDRGVTVPPPSAAEGAGTATACQPSSQASLPLTPCARQRAEGERTDPTSAEAVSEALGGAPAECEADPPHPLRSSVASGVVAFASRAGSEPTLMTAGYQNEVQFWGGAPPRLRERFSEAAAKSPTDDSSVLGTGAARGVPLGGDDVADDYRGPTFVFVMGPDDRCVSRPDTNALAARTAATFANSAGWGEHFVGAAVWIAAFRLRRRARWACRRRAPRTAGAHDVPATRARSSGDGSWRWSGGWRGPEGGYRSYENAGGTEASANCTSANCTSVLGRWYLGQWYSTDGASGDGASDDGASYLGQWYLGRSRQASQNGADI